MTSTIPQASAQPLALSGAAALDAAKRSNHPVRFEGKTVHFQVTNPNDVVQRHHVRGRFYEIDDLLMHRKLIPHRGIVIDVGANVGNHTVFYAQHTRAKTIYPLEPNPEAMQVLTENIRINELTEKINFSKIQFGASDASGTASLFNNSPNNLGKTSLSLKNAGEGGISVNSLDNLFDGITPNLIKIDVEGMELLVLNGAIKLIQRTRPALAIEVDNLNIAKFWKWCEDLNYHVLDASKAHRPNINYICISKQ